MKRLIASLLLVSQLLVATTSTADQPTIPVDVPPAPAPVPGEVDVGAAISPMRKGQLAPFTGVLLSPKAIATIIAELGSFSERVALEVEHARAVEQANCEFNLAEESTRLETDKRILQAQLDARQKELQVVQQRLEKEEADRPNTTLWAGLGFGAGVAVTVLTVVAVGQASK